MAPAAAITAYLISCTFLYGSSSATYCQPPDVPSKGSYEPTQNRYLPGDKVLYNCSSGYLRSGKESRTCQVNGKWTDKIPFCDFPVKLKNPTASSASHSSMDIHRLIDKDPRTCFRTKPSASQSIRLFLDDPAIVRAVRLYLPKGRVQLEISTIVNGFTKICYTISKVLEENQWVMVSCNSTDTSDSIFILDVSGAAKFLEICEAEAYVKDSSLFCEEPPDVFILNGWMKVNRERATLYCTDGYKPGENTRLVCDTSGRWSDGILQCEEILCDRPKMNTTAGDWQFVGRESKLSVGSVKKLKCEHGYEIVGKPDTITCMADGTWSRSTAVCTATNNSRGYKYKNIIIAATAVVSVVIIACSVIVIVLLFKRKSKPVVVVLKPGEDINSVGCGDGGQYSTITYDTMPTLTGYPSPPMSRRPVENLNEYSKHVMDPPPSYVNSPQRHFKESLQVEMDMKQSPVYGSS